MIPRVVDGALSVSRSALIKEASIEVKTDCPEARQQQQQQKQQQQLQHTPKVQGRVSSVDKIRNTFNRCFLYPVWSTFGLPTK